MPTDRDDEAEISAMLNQAEPPKSPQHLDTAILDYAAKNAAISTRRPESSGFFLSLDRLQQNWIPAAVTLSVAVIGVSISLQIFTESDLTNTSKLRSPERALGDSVALRQSDSITAVAELEEQTGTSVQAVLQDGAPRSLTLNSDAGITALGTRELADANVSPLPIPPESDSAVRVEQGVRSRDGLLAVEAVDQLDANSNPAAAATAADSSQPVVSLNVETSDDRVEDVPATGSVVRRSAISASALQQEPQFSLVDNIRADTALRETVIFVLRSSLGLREQTTLATQPEFSSQVNPLVETYRQLSDPAILTNIQNSYSVARSERQEVRLPDLIEELVVVLEALEQ